MHASETPFRRGNIEVELVEGFHERQVRQLQTRPQVARAARIHFAAQKLVQNLGIARLLLGGLFQEVLQASLDRFQSEAAQRGLQSFDGSHRAPPIATLS